MNIQISWIRDLLYQRNKSVIKESIRTFHDPFTLHIIAYNYNWDEGFDVPWVIIKNEYCDYGTALMLFWLADGYSYFHFDDTDNSLTTKEWFSFVDYCYDKILKADFKNKNIRYIPELSKALKYKLKKSNPEIADVFTSGTQGEYFEIPVL